MKLAAKACGIPKVPAPLTLFESLTTTHQNDYDYNPHALGLIATRSVSEPLLGIDELVEQGKQHIQQGILAYQALSRLQKNPHNTSAQKALDAHGAFLGYGLLLKKYTPNVTDATEAQIQAAAQDLKPRVGPLFFSFRLMVACGFLLLLLFATGVYLSLRQKLHTTRWYLHVAFWSLPLPWIGVEVGWIVAEYGRQPWAVEDLLHAHGRFFD